MGTKNKKAKNIYRFTELYNGYFYIDDLVEKALGNPYIEIKAFTQEKAENKLKEDYQTIKSYVVNKI